MSNSRKRDKEVAIPAIFCHNFCDSASAIQGGYPAPPLRSGYLIRIGNDGRTGSLIGFALSSSMPTSPPRVRTPMSLPSPNFWKSQGPPLDQLNKLRPRASS